jgi:midasin
MPEEVAEEESGDGPTQPASGLGLGEGEGEKNVSDRLESEDQLEGAKQEGQEEEEPADKDVKVCKS